MGVSLLNLMTMYEALHVKEEITGIEWLTDITLDPRLDKEMLILQLVSECGNMDTPWNDTRLYDFKHKLWFKMHELEITKLADTVFDEYDWKDNYHMRETERRRLGRNEAERRGRNYNEHDGNGGTDTETLGYQHGTETENLVSAFNETLYQPREKTITTPSGGSDTRQTDYGRTQDSSGNEKETTLHGVDEAEGTDTYRHGNTGVYTNQDLLKKEREVAIFNIYHWIVNEYKKEMLYLVY